MAKKYTDEDLIEILQQKAKELGRSPKAKEVKQWATIRKHFGSFKKGLEVAGLTPSKRTRKRTYTESDLIEILRQKETELGRPPRIREVKQSATIIKHFGSFNAGLEAAGLTPITTRKRKRTYTESELIEILQQKAKELGRAPKLREVKQNATIKRHFGSFNAGLKAAGLTPNRTYTESDLIEILQQKAKELGRAPKTREVKQAGAIIKHFGSFSKGLEAAGLELNKTKSRRKTYTKKKLIEILQQKAKELGRAPKQREVKQSGAIIKF
ncbi:hypothetical protein AB4672_21380 [Bacillus paralicheniformis]|uniref:homing endonuclease associated repeat-containing protein n=1 Tax=Bacillus paralicheniformis TaxID=1648923 RepID=UPI0034D2B7F5